MMVELQMLIIDLISIPGTQRGLPVGKRARTCERHVSSGRHTEPDARAERIYSVVTCTIPPMRCNPITTRATRFVSSQSRPANSNITMVCLSSRIF